jgi:hypothetical protein
VYKLCRRGDRYDCNVPFVINIFIAKGASLGRKRTCRKGCSRQIKGNRRNLDGSLQISDSALLEESLI